jgi:hypothetical protein
MLSYSRIEQLNVRRSTCNIVVKVASADSFCSVVWWGARAGCAKVSTGSAKVRLGFRRHVAPKEAYGCRYIRKNNTSYNYIVVLVAIEGRV